MKTRFRTLALLCAIFAISTPLVADNLLDVVAEAENTIVQKYPVETSIAHRLAMRELENIVFSDKTDEEKIVAIRAKYPPVSVQTGTVPAFNPALLIFRQPLQWSIQSIEIAYDLDSVTNVLFSMESLYREENSKSRDDSKGESDIRKNNSGSKNDKELSAGVSVQTPSSFSWNPLKWIQPKASFQWVNTNYSGQDSASTTSSQWNERAQRALRDLYEEKANILRDERISKRHLTFYILFKNNTDMDFRFNPQDFIVTVYAGENRPLADARPDTSLRSFRIPRNGEADLKFRAELNTTSALNLIAYMRSNEPQIRLDRAQSLIASSDGSIQDAVQESIQVETVPFRCRGLELRIRKYNQGKATTVADAMRAVNAVFTSAPFVFNDEGACISLMGIPLVTSGGKPAEHRLPVVGLDGGFTSAPIPASELNHPISDEGLSVDVWDITDSKMWDNASTQLHAYLLPYLKAVAEADDAQAQFQLGKCYSKGYSVKKDIKEAVNWWRKAAEQGFAKAQYNLGWCYANGEGIPKDDAEAIKWFRKAAEQGFAEAQYNLGLCFANGRGVSQNYPEAAKWWRKAAEQGLAEAQYGIGRLSYNGYGGAKDIVEAVKWFRKAAEQGNENAQFDLAGCYFNGEGITKDISEAVKWYRKSAEQGLAIAQLDLGWCFANGEGVTKDEAEAIKWFKRAAEQGFAEAQYQLGCCYYYGNGVAANRSEAIRLFRMAANQGDELAKQALRWLGYQ